PPELALRSVAGGDRVRPGIRRPRPAGVLRARGSRVEESENREAEEEDRGGQRQSPGGAAHGGRSRAGDRVEGNGVALARTSSSAAPRRTIRGGKPPRGRATLRSASSARAARPRVSRRAR